MAAKRTLNEEVILSGTGIHSGCPVSLRMIPSDSGEIVFRRTDLRNSEFRLSLQNVVADNCTILVTDKGRIRTLEHLLAVFWVYGIDSLTVELDQEEIPAMDGSALPFVHAVSRAGFKDLAAEKAPIKIARPFHIAEKDASVTVEPAPGLNITCNIDFKHPSIGSQTLSLTIDPESFEREIAPARTFGFLEDVSELHERGLALGGSLENAVVLDKSRVISGPLRYPDEFVRHKILDFLGDLSLVGNPLIGHFTAKKAGHALHQKLVRFILENPEYYILEK